MSRIEYDLFRADHPEFKLPDWLFLWNSDINKILIMTPESLHRHLAENTLLGRQTFGLMKGSRGSIFDLQ